MIQPQTYLTVADNTGARKIMCIRILGNNKKYGNIGDVIIGVVKDATPNMPVKRSDVVRAVIVWWGVFRFVETAGLQCRRIISRIVNFQIVLVLQFFIFCFGLYVWLLGSGCGKPQSVDVWPPPRPLGADTAIRTKESPLFSPPKGTLTLSQVLALSIQYGPNLPVAVWTVRAGEAKIKQVSRRPDPELETELETLGEIETTIQLKYLIELGRKRIRRQTVAQLSARLLGWEYEGQRLDTLTETTLAFIDVLQAQALVAVNQGLVQLAEQIFSTVRRQVELGVKAGIEQAPAQIELANSHLILKQSQQSLVVARQALAATWGQATPTFDRVEGQLEAVSSVPPIEQLLEQMMSPELARWQTEIELRKAIIEIEKSNRRPDITVGGTVLLTI